MMRRIMERGECYSPRPYAIFAVCTCSVKREDFCLSGAVFAGTFIAFTLPILLFHFFFSFRKTTNLWMITIAFALLSHVTCSIFEDVGVTCELEQESVRVCGNQEVKVNKCRGTCQSSSRIIMTKPWYRTTCACCKSKKSIYKEVSCNDGRVKQIFSAVSCQCQMCNGA